MLGSCAAPIADAGKVPDPAAASAILGRRVNARAGYALADAFGPAFRARHPPLSDAAGWACQIMGPQPGLVLVDADPQPVPSAPGAGSRTPPEPEPGRRAKAQPTVSSPGYGAVPHTEPVFARQAPHATTQRDDLTMQRDDLTVRNGSAAETGVAAGKAPAALDPPATAAHFGALTALDRRHGYLPAVAAPLSVAESRAEERHRFDPLEFAEQVRMALIDDARRHGIGV